MTEQHPITPPLELIKRWEEQHFDEGENYDVMLIQVYQAGADHELEACCKWLADDHTPVLGQRLRAARRPKPPSLKQQALKELAWVDKHLKMPLLNQCEAIYTIRRALEQLDD